MFSQTRNHSERAVHSTRPGSAGGGRLVTLLAAVLIHLSQAAPVEGRPVDFGAVDLRSDVRLGQRVLLRAQAIPISRVLARLTDKTGIILTVSGRIGDERLVAFVPDAPLVDVLRSIADLYGLHWTRWGDPKRPRYRLEKLPATVREHAVLKERALREMLERLASLAQMGEQVGAVQDAIYGPEWRRALPGILPDTLPAISSNLGLLLREGYLYIPVGRLSGGVQARFTSQLQPALNRFHERMVAAQEQLHEQARREGRQYSLALPGALGPPPLVHECTLVAELQLLGRPGIWLGLRDRYGDGHTLLSVSGDDLAVAGRNLYRNRELRPPAQQAVPPRTAEDGGSLDRILSIVPNARLGATDWIGRLSDLSDAANVSIYADCYLNFVQGLREHPRTRFLVPPTTSVAAALDQLCQLPIPDQSTSGANSFWWRTRDGAIVRSSRWLWEEETVLPADLLDGLVDSIHNTKRLRPRDLSALAMLTGFQIQGSGYMQGRMDAWIYAVRAPARLRIPAQQRVLAGSLDWHYLLPEDQALLLRLLPPQRGVSAPQYTASIEASVVHVPSQGGALLQLSLSTQWGNCKLYGGLNFPLPGAANRKGLGRRGLLVLTKRRAHPPVNPPRLVCALYYPSYATPAVSRAYRKLEDVSVVERRIGNFPHYPASGPYDSTDPDTIRRHLAQLKGAGVDVLVCSWSGPGEFEERAIQKLLPVAGEFGLRLCLLVEPSQPIETASVLGQRLERIIKAIAADPAYLKVDGRAAIFIQDSANQQIDPQVWADALVMLDNSIPPGVFVVASGGYSEDALLFDGLYAETTFPADGAGRLQAGPDVVRGNQLLHAQFCRARRRIAVSTVCPGLQRANSPPAVDRRDGSTYQASWEAAIQGQPDWILINSFNHWETGTEIEPSIQFGERYLRLTGSYAHAFKESAVHPGVGGRGHAGGWLEGAEAPPEGAASGSAQPAGVRFNIPAASLGS